jgi:cob(I)alamin adenosyltransferase
MYTGSGDDGYTGLLGPGRVPKYDLRPEAYGQVDELQAVLGMCRAAPLHWAGQEQLSTIERDLYHMMVELATTPGTPPILPPITVVQVAWLEHITAELTARIPPLTGFVLPGDSPTGALAHLGRTVARRAERAVARLLHTEEITNPEPLRYLNRLSSFLFVLACYEDWGHGKNQPTLSRQK